MKSINKWFKNITAMMAALAGALAGAFRLESALILSMPIFQKQKQRSTHNIHTCAAKLKRAARKRRNIAKRK